MSKAVNHAAAFLQAICEAPLDDRPRLIYADCLEEHGQEDRGEFIRVQIAIADLSLELHSAEDCGDAGCPGCQERRALQQRERELLLEHWKEWTPKGYEVILSPRWTYSNGVSVKFVRGFIGEVHCQHDFWVGTPCELCSGNHPVTRVRLVGIDPIPMERFGFWWDPRIRNSVGLLPATYDSEEAAHAAIGPAALAWARRKAGLPALTPEPC